jgi:hypothetical protein
MDSEQTRTDHMELMDFMLTRQPGVVLKNFGLFKYGENLIRSSSLGVAEPKHRKNMVSDQARTQT